jgi:hypothetical protein
MRRSGSAAARIQVRAAGGLRWVSSARAGHRSFLRRKPDWSSAPSHRSQGEPETLSAS